MKAFINHLIIQFKIDGRDKGTLLTFYLVPLLFFFVMGAVFSSITPMMKTTLAAAMTIFALTMGAVMGVPVPLVKMQESGTVRAFRVNGIPGWAVLAVHAISAFLHLLLVSVIIYLVSPLVFHSELPASPGLYFGILILFLIASIGIGLLLGVTAKSQSLATMLSMMVFMPSLLLSGIMFPANMLPQLLTSIGYIFPATQALQAFLALAYRTEAELSSGISLALMAGISLLLYALAIWRFNRLQKK